MLSNKKNTSAIIMGLWIFVMFPILIRAYSSYPQLIPNGGVFSCDTCHNANYTLQSFGSGFLAAGSAWTQALALADSDGDQFTNGNELQDPNGTWSPGQPSPGNPDLVTNPGDPASHPSPPTATPTATPVPPTATPTPTFTRTSTPTPTNTLTPSPTSPPGSPTNTAPPTSTITSTPSPTFTPIPDTFTPTTTPTLPSATPSRTPYPTSTATQAPTMTPKPCRTTRVEIVMPSDDFHAGDTFYCNVNVCNAEDTQLTEMLLFVILDVYGTLYFAPSFTEVLDYRVFDFQPGITSTGVVPEFIWPANAGSASGITWFAGIMTPDMKTIVSMDMATFCWE